MVDESITDRNWTRKKENYNAGTLCEKEGEKDKKKKEKRREKKTTNKQPNPEK